MVLKTQKSNYSKVKEAHITRKHNLMISKEQCMLDIKKYSFYYKAVNIWNMLPADCVNAKRANLFKNRIVKYLLKAGYV